MFRETRLQTQVSYWYGQKAAVPPRFHRSFTMRRRGVSRPPFWAPKIFKANRQTQQIRHRQMCWKLACTPPQRRRRRNPGRTMTLVAKPPLSMGQCPATQRNLQLSWKSGEEEIKFRRLMRLRKNVWTGETNPRPPSVLHLQGGAVRVLLVFASPCPFLVSTSLALWALALSVSLSSLGE